ncbi:MULTISPECIES: dihydrolipoamide acetyltransferase [Fusobacterium]|uniref:dihydrolipoamide acetyltransferase n=1 Tax=Fusobacterium TaxID=848 RepID=UPI00307EA125
MEEKIVKKVNFNKGGAGGYTPRITLNSKWVNDMGITKENSEIELTYRQETKEIVIKKK